MFKNLILKKILSFAKDHSTSILVVATILITIYSYLYSTRYYAQFGIDITEYSNFTAFYRTALSGNAVKFITTAACFLILIAFACKSIFARIDKNTVNRKLEIVAIKPTIFVSLMDFFPIFLVIAFLFSLFLKNSIEVKQIKDGFSNRVTVQAADKIYRCVSTIGSSSEYFFYWDNDIHKALIIPRSKLSDILIELDFAPRNFAPYMTKSSMKNRLIAYQEFLIARDAWSKRLQTLCHQSVIWPESGVDIP